MHIICYIRDSINWIISDIVLKDCVCVLTCDGQIKGLAMCDSQFLATCDEAGSLRVRSVMEREQTLQFQVMEQVGY